MQLCAMSDCSIKVSTVLDGSVCRIKSQLHAENLTGLMFCFSIPQVEGEDSRTNGCTTMLPRLLYTHDIISTVAQALQGYLGMLLKKVLIWKISLQPKRETKHAGSTLLGTSKGIPYW